MQEEPFVFLSPQKETLNMTLQHAAWLDCSLAQSSLTNLLWYFPSLLPRNWFKLPFTVLWTIFLSLRPRAKRQLSLHLKACTWISLGTFLCPLSPSVVSLSENLNLSLSTTKCLAEALHLVKKKLVLLIWPGLSVSPWGQWCIIYSCAALCLCLWMEMEIKQTVDS